MEKEENQEKELLKIKKKYSIKYVLTAKLFEIYVIFLLLVVASIYTSNFGITIASVLLLIAIILITLILSKKSASQTYICFYETKVIYKRKFLFINREKTMNYSDIKDIVFTQGTNWLTKFFQKSFGLGNIYIYPKKGNILINGISLEVVENINGVIENIKTNIGDRIK